MYLQGNAGKPLHRLPVFESLLLSYLLSAHRLVHTHNVTVVAVAPRSYWKSTPRTPTERGLLIDYRATLSYITQRWAEANVVLYGHSLGGAVAVCLLSQLKAEEYPNVKGLILENPLASVPGMVRALYSSRWVPYHYLGDLAWDRCDAVGAASTGTSTTRIKTVVLQTFPEDVFRPDHQRCAELITPRIRAMFCVTPNNPTGATYPPSLIASFAALARKRNIVLVVDETYRDFIAKGPPHYLFHNNSVNSTVASNQPPLLSWRSTVASLYSFSESYCIPGHRLGCITASPDLLPHFTRIFDCLQICAPRGAQRAFLTMSESPVPGSASLLPALRPFICDSRSALAARHALFRTHLPPAWQIASYGAYYAFVRHPFAGKDARDVFKRLAEEIGVVCLPVAFFLDSKGSGGQVREEDRYVLFSIANVSDEKIRLVCEWLLEAEKTFGWALDA